ncbi:MAG: NADH-quinone oxidoreductase subunit J [Fimbriimonadaceae bacterium]|nr:NADH-quinone oxidoreductase subunit J [Fimbriimonadaceae bacterium]
MDTSLLIFGALAGVAALSAVGVVAFGSPVRSALCLVVNFFTLAFLYFKLNAELLGIVQILVYTGAIMVLFLFVVMLLHLGGPAALMESRDIKRVFGATLGVALFAVLVSQVILPLRLVTTGSAPEGFGAPPAMGRALFTEYAWPFEVASILLLIGVVGSILLAKRKI